MKIKVGQYFYGRHRNKFGVWIYDFVSCDSKSSSGSFVCDFREREEARLFVWKMNGWGVPATALPR